MESRIPGAWIGDGEGGVHRRVCGAAFPVPVSAEALFQSVRGEVDVGLTRISRDKI